MIIKKRRIRNLGANLGPVRKGSTIVIGIVVAEFEHLLKRAGFTDDLAIGESVLPSAVFGPISAFNAQGKYIKHKDQPMETAYRVQEWHWEEWHGPDRVPESKLVDVPYKRYPRTFVPPPSVELCIAVTPDKRPVAVSPPIEYVDENEELLVHTINLFLEIFRECQVYTEDLDEIARTPVRRLNWTVLPPGRWPWEKLREKVEPLIEQAPGGNQVVIRHRFELLNSYGPDFVAIGRAGFRGYVIFGFIDQNLFVCESMYEGNATYVFDDRWEVLSQMTKAQILEESLQTARIIHRSQWDGHIHKLLRERGQSRPEDEASVRFW